MVEAKDAEPTLDPCVYEGATVAALFNGQAGDTLTQKPYLPTSSCKYKGYAGNTRIDLTIAFKGDPLDPPNNLDPDYALIDGFGTDVYVKDMSRTAGYGSSSRAYQIARPGGQIRVDLNSDRRNFSCGHSRDDTEQPHCADELNDRRAQGLLRMPLGLPRVRKVPVGPQAGLGRPVSAANIARLQTRAASPPTMKTLTNTLVGHSMDIFRPSSDTKRMTIGTRLVTNLLPIFGLNASI